MSKTYEITAKVGKEADAPSATINLNGPETVEEAIQMYGGEAVLTNAMANFTVTMQSRIRAGIKSGKAAADLQQLLGETKMGVSLPRAGVDPVAAIKAKLPKMTDEQKKALLAELRKAAQ